MEIDERGFKSLIRKAECFGGLRIAGSFHNIVERLPEYLDENCNTHLESSIADLYSNPQSHQILLIYLSSHRI